MANCCVGNCETILSVETERRCADMNWMPGKPATSWWHQSRMKACLREAVAGLNPGPTTSSAFHESKMLRVALGCQYKFAESRQKSVVFRGFPSCNCPAAPLFQVSWRFSARCEEGLTVLHLLWGRLNQLTSSEQRSSAERHDHTVQTSRNIPLNLGGNRNFC